MSDALATEVANADFGDIRLSNRLQKITMQLGQKPNESIPAASLNRNELEATYRFFDNPNVTPQAIVAPHQAATLERVKSCEIVLLVQDTTELNLTRPESQVQGAGPLRFESQFGAFYHPLMAFSSEALPLGTLWSKTWAREKLHHSPTKAARDKRKRTTPIEEKESMRWLEGVRQARSVAERSTETQCICIADSEADIYELFAEPLTTSHGKQLQLLIRACHDRSLVDTQVKLIAEVKSQPILYTCCVDASRRKLKHPKNKFVRKSARDSRLAEVTVRACSVTLQARKRFDRTLPNITINVVLVSEINPPEGEAAIEWLLITTLPIGTSEHVKLIVSYYCVRWQIEVYFRTLKSGCRIESRYFERLCRLENCLAVYTIVAWKILELCRLSRTCPDLDCEVVFTPSEWKSVYMVANQKGLPDKRPTLNEMVKLLATLGGYVLRRSTNPGPQTLWIGLQRMYDLSNAWNTFGPGAPKVKKFSIK